ncbi:MAG: 30S ribosomal protein S1, partial [Myxococcota bacterium]|nr:30S ribosomal protein S1 [Myxococcota bacterium]
MSETNLSLDLDADLTSIGAEDFAALFDSYLNTKSIREQTVVTGTITNIDGDWAVVDVGYKAEGVIAVNEFTDEDGNVTIAVGDKVDVFLGSMSEEDGQLSLSKRKADEMKAWEEISKAFEADETVSGMITARVKGGLSVDIGVKAFLPGSQVDLRPVKNLEKLLGEEMTFKIIKFNKRRGNIVLSRRVLLEEERQKQRKETLKDLQVGVIMTGVVKNITDYGAFIDLGGIDGLLHITDMTYGRINHPSEMVEVAQSIEVKILKFDPDTQRVSLGYKQIRPDPWDEVDLKYPVGAIVRGKVVSMPDYGIFVELEDGIEGLVHISEMTWNKRVKHPSKLVNIADLVEAKVIGVDAENKRISLSMRELETNPWDLVEHSYPIGSVVNGKVRNITDFGLFVGIEEGIDGLVHISDLSWSQRVKHPSELYQKGDDVEARVLNIDREGERFSLGIKQLKEDPWLSVQARYFLGQVVKGKVVSRTDFGVFVEIEEGVEGLVHMSELGNATGDWLEAYPEGQELTVEIRRIDQHDRKISLSEKGAVDRAEGGEAVQEYIAKQGDSGARLGDVMGDLGRKLAEAGVDVDDDAADAAVDAAPEADAEAEVASEADAVAD